MADTVKLNPSKWWRYTVRRRPASLFWLAIGVPTFPEHPVLFLGGHIFHLCFCSFVFSFWDHFCLMQCPSLWLPAASPAFLGFPASCFMHFKHPSHSEICSMLCQNVFLLPGCLLFHYFIRPVLFLSYLLLKQRKELRRSVSPHLPYPLSSVI